MRLVFTNKWKIELLYAESGKVLLVVNPLNPTCSVSGVTKNQFIQLTFYLTKSNFLLTNTEVGFLN